MSKFSDFIKGQKQKDLKFFFGDNLKMTSNKYFKFTHVKDDDNIIIFTKNVKYWFNKDQYLLVVDNNKAIYLKSWQVKEVCADNGVCGYAVKLNRNFFKTYTFSFDFEGFLFEKEDTFDSLVEVAKEQDFENMPIKQL